MEVNGACSFACSVQFTDLHVLGISLISGVYISRKGIIETWVRIGYLDARAKEPNHTEAHYMRTCYVGAEWHIPGELTVPADTARSFRQRRCGQRRQRRQPDASAAAQGPCPRLPGHQC